MSDFYLDLLSKTFNLGIPLALILFYLVKNDKPKFLLTGAFANFQLLILFLVISLEYHLNNEDEFAYYAMWQMAGWVGPILTILGLLIGKYLVHSRSAFVNIVVGASLGSFIWLV